MGSAAELLLVLKPAPLPPGVRAYSFELPTPNLDALFSAPCPSEFFGAVADLPNVMFDELNDLSPILRCKSFATVAVLKQGSMEMVEPVRGEASRQYSTVEA